MCRGENRAKMAMKKSNSLEDGTEDRKIVQKSSVHCIGIHNAKPGQACASSLLPSRGII